MILANLIFFLVRLSDVKAAFYSSGTEYGKVKYKDIIHKATAPSLISCSLRCRVIDADADAVFEKDVCSCIKTSGNHDDNDKEVTLTGMFSTRFNKIKPKKWKRQIIADDKELSIEPSSYLAPTIPYLTTEYIISFDFKPTQWKNWHTQVLNLAGLSDRGTSFWFEPRNKLLIFAGTVVGKPEYGYGYISPETYALNKWMNIKLSQREEMPGIFRSSIEVNGQLLHSIINNDPIEIKNMRFYKGSLIESVKPQPGFVKNIWVSVRNK